MSVGRANDRAEARSSGPGPTTVVALLRRAAEQVGKNLAYRFLTDADTMAEVCLTNGELDRRARALAVRLGRSAPAGARALLLVPPGPAFLTAFFGTLCGGLVAVPVYPPHPSRPQAALRRLQPIWNDARPAVVLTTSRLRAQLEHLARESADLASAQWLAVDETDLALADGWRDPEVSGDTVCVLQYTSGSTSRPSGVVLTHANILHNSRLIQDCFEFTPSDGGVSWLPHYHDMGLIGGVLQPFFSGAPVTLMAPLDFLQRPVRWLRAMSYFRATISVAPTFAYDLCVRRISPEQRAGLDLSGWQVAAIGAEPIRPQTLERFVEAFGPHGFRMDAFLPCYGLAEATLIVSGKSRGSAPVLRTFGAEGLRQDQALEADPGTPGARALVSCGQPRPGQEVLIVDPSSRVPCREGRIGEIWVRGPSVARGYWNLHEQSGQTFGAHIAEGGAGPFLRTGDLGFLAQGELFVTGRIKDLIIIDGRNHYPQDIEATVLEALPSLQPPGCVAFSVDADGRERLVIVAEAGRPGRDRPGGESGRAAGISAAVGAIIPLIRAAVAEAHDVPVHGVCLIKAGSLPRTTSGKARRRACRDQFLAGELDLLES